MVQKVSTSVFCISLLSQYRKGPLAFHPPKTPALTKVITAATHTTTEQLSASKLTLCWNNLKRTNCLSSFIIEKAKWVLDYVDCSKYRLESSTVFTVCLTVLLNEIIKDNCFPKVSYIHGLI